MQDFKSSISKQILFENSKLFYMYVLIKILRNFQYVTLHYVFHSYTKDKMV